MKLVPVEEFQREFFARAARGEPVFVRVRIPTPEPFVLDVDPESAGQEPPGPSQATPRGRT